MATKKTTMSWTREEIQKILERKEMVKIKSMTLDDEKGIEAEIK